MQKTTENNTHNQFVSNSIWSLAGALLSKGLIFISWILVARIIGKEAYGQFGIIRSTILMFASFSALGLGITASKYVAEFMDKDAIKAGRVIGLTYISGGVVGLLMAVIVYSLAPLISYKIFNTVDLLIELRISSIIILLSSINGAQLGTLQGFSAFRLISKINIIQSLISFPLFVVGAYFLGVYGTVWAFVINYLIVCLLSFQAVRNQARENLITIGFWDSLNELEVLYKYSLPAFLGGIMVLPVKWFTEAILVKENGFPQMGIFTAASTINLVILMVSSAISAPLINQMIKDKNKNNEGAVTNFNIIGSWVLGLCCLFPLMLFPETGSYLFGASFKGDDFNGTYLFILFYTLIALFKQGFARLVAVHNMQWHGFVDNLIWAILLLISFHFTNHSAKSLAFSYIISYVLNTVIMTPYYYHKNLIARGTVLNLRVFSYWTIAIFSLFVGLNNYSIYFRFFLVILFLSIILLTTKFQYKFNKNINR